MLPSFLILFIQSHMKSWSIFLNIHLSTYKADDKSNVILPTAIKDWDKDWDDLPLIISTFVFFYHFLGWNADNIMHGEIDKNRIEKY